MAVLAAHGHGSFDSSELPADGGVCGGSAAAVGGSAV